MPVEPYFAATKTFLLLPFLTGLIVLDFNRLLVEDLFTNNFLVDCFLN